MIIYTDNIEYAGQVLSPGLSWEPVSPTSIKGETKELAANLFHASAVAVSTIDWNYIWKYLFIVKYAPESQYDVLIRLAQTARQLPNGILCLAGSGSKLHGFKNRPWVALPGNIHLSVILAPDQKMSNFGVGFTILSAVSVIESIDSVVDLTGKTSLKWVNDILIENAKVAGVLAHTQSQGEMVTGAVLGIGINVESTPEVERDPFVPRVASLRDFIEDPQICNQRVLFDRLTHSLDKNYRLLLNGHYEKLLNSYRRRSMVIGREVSIYPDSPETSSEEVVHGQVTGIGENLELYLQGIDAPITKGRLVMKS